MVEKRNPRSPHTSSTTAVGAPNVGASSSSTQAPTIEVVQSTKQETVAPTQSAPPQLYIEAAIRNNFSVLEYCRTVQSAASGIASGCLGLTATWGFLFYFACVAIQAICWHYKAGGKRNEYFATQSVFVTHSMVGGLFTYVLFWVFFYGIVHVY